MAAWMLTHKFQAKRKQKENTTMTMLRINGCLLLLLGTLASLASAQPMSLKEPIQPHLSCNFLTCTGAILGKFLIWFSSSLS